MKVLKTIICIILSLLLVGCAEVTPNVSTEELCEETDGKDGSRINILVGGTDRASGLTDCLMLFSLNTKKGTAALMQIPRDTYLNYTSDSYKKINGAYSKLKSGRALSTFIGDCLGVVIDEYIIISPDTLCSLVDAIGGVEVDIPEDMYYKDSAQGLVIDLKSGRQTLDGKEAEGFIRYRSGYENGDLGRLDAQKIFLSALYSRLSGELDAYEMLALAKAFSSGCDTSLSFDEIMTLYGRCKEISGENIILLTAPGRPLVATQSGASYYVLSSPSMGEVLSLYFGGSSDGFDGDNIFLNTKYEEFENTYYNYSEYFVYRIKDY